MNNDSKITRRHFVAIGTGSMSMAASYSTPPSGKQRRNYGVFSPGHIGKLRVKNRLVKAATAEGAGVKGEISAEGLEMYRAVARGGAGMAITGGMAVVPSGQAGQKLTWIFADRFISSVQKIAAVIHDADNSTAAIAQLCHLGVDGDRSVGPSARGWPWKAGSPYPLSAREIDGVVESHARAAWRLREAGFDGIEIHAGHGYLLSAFLSPFTNTREDDYGGAAQARVAIISEIVERIRLLTGPAFPVIVKINCDDGVDGGIDIVNFPTMVREIEKTGVDAIEISGNKRQLPVVLTPDEESYYLKHVKGCRFAVPVILTGGNRSVECLEGIFAQRQVSFFGLGRPLIREPNLPNRWLQGVGGASSTCISCNRCVRGLSRGQVTRCRVHEDTV